MLTSQDIARSTGASGNQADEWASATRDDHWKKKSEACLRSLRPHWPRNEHLQGLFHGKPGLRACLLDGLARIAIARPHNRRSTTCAALPQQPAEFGGRTWPKVPGTPYRPSGLGDLGFPWGRASLRRRHLYDVYSSEDAMA
jgi:hypothetical protein